MKAFREILAGCGLLFTILITALNYSTLPQKIPTHFNSANTANGWSDKSFLWIMVAFAVFEYLVLSLVRFIPMNSFSGFSSASPEQRAAALPFVHAMFDWIKVEVTCLFAFIVYAMFAAAQSGKSMTALFLPVIFGVDLAVIATIIYYTIRSKRTAATIPDAL